MAVASGAADRLLAVVYSRHVVGSIILGERGKWVGWLGVGGARKEEGPEYRKPGGGRGKKCKIGETQARDRQEARTGRKGRRRREEKSCLYWLHVVHGILKHIPILSTRKLEEQRGMVEEANVTIQSHTLLCTVTQVGNK